MNYNSLKAGTILQSPEDGSTREVLLAMPNRLYILSKKNKSRVIESSSAIWTAEELRAKSFEVIYAPRVLTQAEVAEAFDERSVIVKR